MSKSQIVSTVLFLPEWVEVPPTSRFYEKFHGKEGVFWLRTEGDLLYTLNCIYIYAGAENNLKRPMTEWASLFQIINAHIVLNLSTALTGFGTVNSKEISDLTPAEMLEFLSRSLDIRKVYTFILLC